MLLHRGLFLTDIYLLPQFPYLLSFFPVKYLLSSRLPGALAGHNKDTHETLFARQDIFGPPLTRDLANGMLCHGQFWFE